MSDRDDDEESREKAKAPGQEPGRRIAAAVLSIIYRTSLRVMYEEMRGKPVGEGWVELAREVVAVAQASYVASIDREEAARARPSAPVFDMEAFRRERPDPSSGNPKPPKPEGGQ